MATSCVFKPTIPKTGEVSKLYDELISTTKDRKLTNLLYAISMDDSFKSRFTKNDFNTQGELKTKVVLDYFQVNDILSDAQNLLNEAKSIGAKDSNGSIIYYDDVNSIIGRVLDYNTNHPRTKAAIKKSKDGFYIEVDTINAENYNTNNALRIKMSLYDELISLLQSKGFNVNFSESTKSLVNPLSVYSAIDTIRSFKGDLSNLSPYNASILIDLMSGDPLVTRLKNMLGDDLAVALSQVAGYKVASPIALTSYQNEQLLKLLDKQGPVATAMHKIPNASWDGLLTKAKAGVSLEETFMNTDGMTVKSALKELYTLYHLDQENLDALHKKIDKISDAAHKILQSKVLLLKEQERKTGKNRKAEKALLGIQSQIDRHNYSIGILELLRELTKELSGWEAEIRLLERRIKNNPGSTEHINTLSAAVMRYLEMINTYTPILKELLRVDKLENDDDVQDSQVVDSIKDVANSLLSTFSDLETKCRSTEYDAVYAFLKIYWGEDTAEAQERRGSATTLAQIMEMAKTDINFFDRLVYAVGDTNDEMMNLIGQAVKQAHYNRDNALRKDMFSIRTATDELYSAGSDTSFMYEKDENGYPAYILSDYDYSKFNKEYEEYKAQIHKDPTILRSQWATLENEWFYKHTKRVKLFGLSMRVPIYEKSTKVTDVLSPAQFAYYNKMMAMRADMIKRVQATPNESLFEVIEVSNDAVTALAEAGGNPVKAFNIVKNKVLDTFSTREDDTEYGEMLNANGIVIDRVSPTGERLNSLPIFYTHKIKDRSRVSTDFSKSMVAFMAASTQYAEMNKIVDALMLAKDYLMVRRVGESVGSRIVGSVTKFGRADYFTMATKSGAESLLGGLANDYYERVVFGKKKEPLYVGSVRLDKALDALVGYTSITGLAVNAFGAEVNLLVGKLQMLIESGMGMGGEFFNMKDMAYADAKYFALLPALLGEVNSNNKSSLLGLLMERFDVQDDFYEKIKETGFYKNVLQKMVGNANLMILYGLGEHLLHAQTMLAILHNTKVVDSNNNEARLIDAFEVRKEGRNGELVVKDGYSILTKNGEKVAITDETLDKLKRRIAYCNQSMHGAFGEDEKGMLHKYAVGRLIANFRQWMPAHYSRRFRGKHYNSLLEEYREGYYVTTAKFVWGLCKELRQGKLQIAAHWHELSDMEKYNIKRAVAEVAILASLSAIIALIGSEKDHKGNWAARHLLYVLKRLHLETSASTPVTVNFGRNIVKTLNSPMACLNTIEKIGNIAELTNLFETVQSGKHKGENKYLHNLEKSVPFYGQIRKQIEIGTDNSLFLLFNY